MRSIRPMAGIEESARPKLAPHVRLRFDATRGQHALLSPETVLILNDTGTAIVQLCDGHRTVAQIRTELQRRYADVSDAHIEGFLGELVAKHGMEVHHGQPRR